MQDPAQRIPNIATGKVDITIQFMTVTPQRAQLVGVHAALLRRGHRAADAARTPR